MASELRNESKNEFVDISTELWRCYKFAHGTTVTINGPQWLSVSPSGGHRILDTEGVSHYVSGGWIHLQWVARPGQAHFVK